MTCLSEEWIELQKELEAGRGDHLLLQLSTVEGGERAYATIRCHVGRRHEVRNVAMIEVCGEEVLCGRLVLPRSQVSQAVCAIQPSQDGDIVLLPLDAGTCVDRRI